MRKHQSSALFLALTIPLLGISAAEPDVTMLKAARGALALMRSQPKDREAAAEAAAARFVAGGKLLVSGSIPLFAVEWTNRSGGLMAAAALKDPSALSAADILIYGCLIGSEEADDAALASAREKGALVIAFGTKEQAARLRSAVDFFLSADVASATPLLIQTAACLDLAELWAFTGDFVAACTRADKMPTMWQSIKVPGSTERNRLYRPLRFHEDLHIAPVKPEVLGTQYLDGLIGSLDGLIAETKPIRAAARLIRNASKAGHSVVHANLGHFEPARLLPAGFPIRVIALPARLPETELPKVAAPGDVLFAIWYHEMPRALLDASRSKGMRTIVVAGRNPFAPLDTKLADVYIDPKWVVGDALVEVPGYDIKIIPPSAVLNGLIFYAVMAEATP